MPLPTSIHQYYEIQSVLSSARASGGAIYRIPDLPGQSLGGRARAWRQRAYYYRKLLAKLDHETHGGVPGYVGVTEWDDILLTADPADPTAVIIRFGVVQGTLESLTGEKLDALPVAPKAKKPATRIADSDLLAEAESLAMEIDK